jgi:hypothetical protein
LNKKQVKVSTYQDYVPRKSADQLRLSKQLHTAQLVVQRQAEKNHQQCLLIKRLQADSKKLQAENNKLKTENQGLLEVCKHDTISSTDCLVM